MTNICFIHVATIGNYQQVVDEIFYYISNCSINFSTVYINIAGDGYVNIPKISSLYIFPKRAKLEEFEFSTLNKLKDFADSCVEETNILYVHTKGVTAINNLCISDWREYMLYFNISRAYNALRILKTYDAVGVDLVDEPTCHFSGNIWWTKSSHVKRLPYPQELPCIISDRHKGEFWICSYSKGKYKSQHNSNIDVYSRHLHRFTPNQYKNMKTSINYILHDRPNYAHTFIKEITKIKKTLKEEIVVNLLTTPTGKDWGSEVKQLRESGIKTNCYSITNGAYMTKIKQGVSSETEYCIKLDEDIFLSSNLWEFFLENIDILQDDENIIFTPLLSTGIPTVDYFSEGFLEEDEKNNLYKIYLKTHIPSIWGADYTSLAEHTINASTWNSDNFYNSVNKLDHHYRGVHPVRFSSEAQTFINSCVFNKLERLVNEKNFSTFTDKKPYICNSVFAIKRSTWLKILSDESLFRDEFEEVPLNLYMKQNNLNMVFINNGFAVHPSYNTLGIFGVDYKQISDNFFAHEYFI